MSFEQLQFYPTPKSLAKKAWSKFRDRNFVRVLEPSAGNGDLLAAAPSDRSMGRSPIDCVEIDITRHPRLRDEGYSVVGLDFLQFNSGSMYSHVILNPPFAQGVHHALKAWDLLWDGEIVAILNAETIRNPCSKERGRLVQLVEAHGEVEFVETAFAGEDSERKTNVEVALVYLRKTADLEQDLAGTIMEDLERDSMTAAGLASGYHEPQELALGGSTIENAVTAFNAAVRAARESVFSDARARRYKALLGRSMGAVTGGYCDDAFGDKTSVEYVRRELAERYDDLKDRAWTGILRSSRVTDRLSSAGQKQVESQFAQIKTLEFTVSNIYGFLLGVIENQGEIQLKMACSVFDQITRYHSENAVYYRGWKSNDRHREAGMRIKMTRFILPGHETASWRQHLDFDSLRLLSDFDKVFAMLDGKQKPEYGIEDAFTKEFESLRSGERVSSSYFDLRYYPGAGTIHFFPRNKEVVDRLNRLVGRHREWLPPEDARVSEDFWLQYEKAERFDKELREEVRKAPVDRSFMGSPFDQVCSPHEDRRNHGSEVVDQALGRVLERHGIDVDRALEASQKRLTA
ncbi:DUF4942 domain-containing protein [Thioalkalivibrio sp. ALE6]|uniref:DUF4942 domain-containing protein n=1 Tax=Thioalkalivibrio sp. ALE6 TaxID=1266908 RepID=UPI000373E4DA|nr:DUF4942 domain-containing protein [Thioalkalivibrio sp. ALE6]